ncbi:hypothetical protein RFI_19102 [Reticulomyxa filosa]|uniref:Uncharacterized protein n=1 Tax=Reticulomyxa filosa TaxID=46433 RepID=X6MXG6_RETFI|nr:hypothetical protein RFI_19102 [Reticulomyxa filosa]|eukprot:ETO18177.1 hypothetical protein RFI_19102 [Reticulomyxa filosa]
MHILHFQQRSSNGIINHWMAQWQQQQQLSAYYQGGLKDDRINNNINFNQENIPPVADDSSYKSKNKNMFMINGKRKKKQRIRIKKYIKKIYFLKQIKNRKTNLDSRILKQLKCTLPEPEYGSKYIQKLLDNLSVPIRHIEQLFMLLYCDDTDVYLCQVVSGNYVIQKLLEITCENLRHKTRATTKEAFGTT